MLFKKLRVRIFINRAIGRLERICERDCPKGVNVDDVILVCLKYLLNWQTNDPIGWRKATAHLYDADIPVKIAAVELLMLAWEHMHNPKNYKNHTIPEGGEALISALKSIVDKNIAAEAAAQAFEQFTKDMGPEFAQGLKRGYQNYQGKILSAIDPLIEQYRNPASDPKSVSKAFHKLNNTIIEKGLLDLHATTKRYSIEGTSVNHAAIGLIDGLVGILKGPKIWGNETPSAVFDEYISEFETVIDNYAKANLKSDSPYFPHNGKFAEALTESGMDEFLNTKK